MRVMSRARTLGLMALLSVLVLSLGLVACGGGDDDTTTSSATTSSSSSSSSAAAAQLRGAIEIDGSSTVEPITQAVAEEFKKLHNGVNPNVAVSGTGGGFKRFTVGETAISNASRPIKDAEAADAAANGVEYIELLVAVDGLTVVVNPNNKFATCLTVDELKAMWEPGSTVNNWNQVRSDFPDQPLSLYGPDTDSGTFDYFTEEIVGESQASRADYSPNANDNILVQGIAGDTNSLGYFGFAYYLENQGQLNAVAIDDGNGCVAPTPETIKAGEYTPLSRPLFIYVNTAELEKPEVRAFVDYYLDNAGQLAAEVGYVSLTDAEYDAARKLVESGGATMMEEKMELKGAIEIDGSSTVEPITQAVAEEFKKLHNGVNPNVAVSGTGGGFKRFTVGETAISNASRPIKDAEREQAAANGVEFIELLVAVDGLTVVVNPDNKFATCLTVDELKAMWEPGSEVNNWNQVRSSFPDQSLSLYGPDTDSGTFDYFTEEIVGEAQASRSDYSPNANDNILVQGIAGDTNALGYFGFAYYLENQDRLNAVAIDDGNGCVAPTPENIKNGSYTPLSRPLFIYVNTEHLQRPEVRAFVDFYLDNAAQLASEVGYVALTDAEYDESRAKVN